MMNKRLEKKAQKAIKELTDKGQTERARVLQNVFDITKKTLNGEKLSKKQQKMLKRINEVPME